MYKNYIMLSLLLNKEVLVTLVISMIFIYRKNYNYNIIARHY